MFSLNYQSGEPIYAQLYRSVAAMSALGVLKKSESLPSVRALAQELGINPNTVQKAYAMLEHDGIIRTVPGKGSLVSGSVPALEQQKESAAERLRAAVRGALEMGLTKEEIRAVVSGCLAEGGTAT